jgi:hypothetical protein
MHEVATREIPACSVLCLKRNVDQEGAWDFGKEFVCSLKKRPLPHMEGVAGAAFCIYHGEISEDSDGPVEWWRPVPAGQADELAAASLSSPCAQSPPTRRHSRILARATRSVLRSGSSSPSPCGLGEWRTCDKRANSASG